MANIKKKENDLIGSILFEDSNDNEILRPTPQAFGFIRSTSAPPPGLNDFKLNESSQSNELLASPEYYQYYYSLKPLDPRLPKPLWKPGMATAIRTYEEQPSNIFQPIQKDHSEVEEADEEDTVSNTTNKGSTSDKMSIDSLSNQMSQSLIFATKDTENHSKVSGPNRRNYQQQQYNQNQGYQQNYLAMQNMQTFQGQNQFPQQMPMQYPQGGYFQPNMQAGMNMFQKPFIQQSQPNFPYPQPNFGGYQNAMPTQMGGYQVMPNIYPQVFPMNNPNQFIMQQDMMGMPRYQMSYHNNFQKFGFNNYNNQTQFQMEGNMSGNLQGQWATQTFNQNTQNTKNFHKGNMNKVGDKNQKGSSGGFKSQSQGYQSNQTQQLTKQDISKIMQRTVENCQDQNGSRMLQQYFETATEQDREQIFTKVLPEALKLMKDVFGNYVIQKILEKGTLEQKRALFKACEGEIFNLSVNTYGCRVIQKVLEEFKNDSKMQKKILDELKEHVQECTEDQNGNHVIQKIFETIPHEQLDFIIKIAIDNLKTLAFHAYGCRVIQRILENAPESETAPIIKKLMENCVKLCECQFGNYIMQHILEKGSSHEKTQLLNILKDNFVSLSLNKFASNVTEKSVVFGTIEFRKGVLDVLLSHTGHPNDQPLFLLMNHQFGNYVIQRLFECGDVNIKTKMYNRIKTYDYNEIRQNQYGKHVLSFMEKQMDEIQKS